MCVNTACNVLSAVGAYVLIFYIYDVCKSPIVLSFKYLKTWLGFMEPSLMEKYGDWAAITGSTDGIGKALARALARQGLNTVLIARNPRKLEKVAKQIESDFYVKTKIIVADFSVQTACEHVEEELEKIPVRILINNVSQAKSAPENLENHTYAEVWQMINTNMGAVTELSRYFLNRLKEVKQKGLIVNVSSGVNYTPVPKIALYAATKTFVSALTLALQVEARPYGIDVQLLKPFLVVTKINAFSPDIMRGGLFIPDAFTYARSAVDKFGKTQITTGYFWHAVQSAFNTMCHWRLRLYAINELANLMILRAIENPKWKLVFLKILLQFSFLFCCVSLYFILWNLNSFIKQ